MAKPQGEEASEARAGCLLQAKMLLMLEGSQEIKYLCGKAGRIWYSESQEGCRQLIIITTVTIITITTTVTIFQTTWSLIHDPGKHQHALRALHSWHSTLSHARLELRTQENHLKEIYGALSDLCSNRRLLVLFFFPSLSMTSGIASPPSRAPLWLSEVGKASRDGG